MKFLGKDNKDRLRALLLCVICVLLVLMGIFRILLESRMGTTDYIVIAVWLFFVIQFAWSMWFRKREIIINSDDASGSDVLEEVTESLEVRLHASEHTRQEFLLYEILAEMKVANLYSRKYHISTAVKKLSSDAVSELISTVDREMAAIRDWQKDQHVHAG